MEQKSSKSKHQLLLFLFLFFHIMSAEVTVSGHIETEKEYYRQMFNDFLKAIFESLKG